MRWGSKVTKNGGTVLVVEDDLAFARELERQLKAAGLLVYLCATAETAVRRASENAPDVVVLDLTLPDEDVAEVCRRIRELPAVGDIPILVLSATGELAAKLLMFAVGVDDYVVKPCDPLELVARVHALLRRHGDRRLMRRVGPLRVALATGDAWVQETPLDLTTGERSILVQLARAFPGVTGRETLDRVPWRAADVASNVTEVLVGRLRRKIDEAGGGVEIRAIRRAGYVLRSTTLSESMA